VAAYDFGDRTLAEFCLDRWEGNPDLTARLENCTLVAAGHGLDHRWPLLDVRLIAFFLAVPAEETFGPDGMDRYLHRRAVAGLLPDSVVWNDRSMGMLAPMPDSRWREPVDLRHEVLDGRLRLLVDPERFRRSMDASAGLPAQRHPGDTAHVHRTHRRNVERLDRWRSAVGGD